MLQITVRFSPEQVKAMRSGTFAALQQEIEHRLATHYPELWLSIGKSTRSELSVTGARNDREKTPSWKHWKLSGRTMHGYPNDSRDAVFRREDVFTLTESPTALQLPLLPKLFLPVFKPGR
jgi:DNA-damage-inducible protein I